MSNRQSVLNFIHVGSHLCLHSFNSNITTYSSKQDRNERRIESCVFPLELFVLYSQLWFSIFGGIIHFCWCLFDLTLSPPFDLNLAALWSLLEPEPQSPLPQPWFNHQERPPPLEKVWLGQKVGFCFYFLCFWFCFCGRELGRMEREQ